MRRLIKLGVCKLVNRKSRLTLGLDGENITSLSSRTNVVLKHSTNNSQGLWVIDDDTAVGEDYGQW